jgi:hypothetical protein
MAQGFISRSAPDFNRTLVLTLWWDITAVIYPTLFALARENSAFVFPDMNRKYEKASPLQLQAGRHLDLNRVAHAPS